jgi:hypothetical protein
VIASGLLGFWQERRATDAVSKLLAMVQTKASVIRDGAEAIVPIEGVVPGDILTLAAGDSESQMFEWNTTTSLAYGNYTLKGCADVVAGETNTANNNYTCPIPVHVGVPGDVSGTTPGVYDGITNMKDIAYLVSLFNTRPSSPNWQPNADVNNDGVVNMKDIAIAVAYFNQRE